MFQITKPEVSPLITLDDTDDYTATLTVHNHREKLTAVLDPGQLEALACEAHKLAEQLTTERDAAAADAARPRMEHGFDLATAAEHLTAATNADQTPLDDATRYAWIVRPDRAGMGLWDRQEDKVAWWQRPVTEQVREHTLGVIETGREDWLIWTPAEPYRPFEIAVLS